jgi:hypothetical protein
VDPGGEVVDPSKTTARPSYRRSAGSAAEIFVTAPSGRASRGAQRGWLRSRAVASAIGSPPRFRSQPRRCLADRLARDSDGIEMKQIAQLAHHRREPARVIEVLNQEGARGPQVDEPRRRRAQLVEERQRQLDSYPAGIGEQVQDRVRRAADRVQDADRVLERPSRQDASERTTVAPGTCSSAAAFTFAATSLDSRWRCERAVLAGSSSASTSRC